MDLPTLITKLDAEPSGLDLERAPAITACQSLDQAGAGDVSFFSNRKYLRAARESQAAMIFCKPSDAELLPGKPLLRVKDPYYAFREAMVLLHGQARPTPEPGVRPGANVDPTAVLGQGCAVMPSAVVDRDAKLGDACVLYPGVYVGVGATLGDGCVLHPGVCVYDGCTLGDRVTLHAGTIVGQDGFGYASAAAPGEHAVRHHKIPQVGAVTIGDDVEIGAHGSVERATLGQTIIGEGTKMSNGVTIGHGCKIGRHNLIVAQTGLAGSTVTGDHVVLGGQVGVAGHLRIGSRAQVAGGSKVMRDIPDVPIEDVGTPRGQWGGVPAVPMMQFKRQVREQIRLADLAAKVRRFMRSH